MGDVMAIDFRCSQRIFVLLSSAALTISLTGCITFETSGPEPTSSPESSPQETPVSPSPTDTPLEQSPSVPPSVAPTPPPATEDSQVPETWADIYDRVHTGVALIETTQCHGSASLGTGFLVGEDLVVTAAHVVDGKSSIRLSLGDQRVGAQVLGSNALEDIALLKTAQDLNGHQFEISREAPRMAIEVAAIGYPLAFDIEAADRADFGINVNDGSISGLNQTIKNDTVDAKGAIKFDAKVNPGNSGGPLVNRQGTVVGLVAAKDSSERDIDTSAYAITSERVGQAVEEWKNVSNLRPLEICDSGTGSALLPAEKIDSRHDQAVYVSETFKRHGTAINHGNYEKAFSYFTDRRQIEYGSSDEWSADLWSSNWVLTNVRDVEGTGTRLSARVEFWTIQHPIFGPLETDQWCSVWDNTYELEWNGVLWAIDAVKSNKNPTPCDETALLEELTEEELEDLSSMISWMYE